MAIMSLPSEFTKLKVKHVSATQVDSNEVFNLNIPASSFRDSDTAIAFDAWARSFVNLSTDTYDDCEISEMKIIEKIANPD